MVFKLALSVLCLLAIQASYAQVPLTCSQQVSQLKLELSQLARQARIDVSTATSATSLNIASTRTSIKNAVIAVQDKANGVVGHIVCKNNLNLELAAVDINSVNACQNSLKINELNGKVNQLNTIKGSASLICSTCLNEPTCVATQIDNTRQQAQALQQDISAGADAFLADSIQCAQNAGNEQLSIINKASDNFDACVSGA